MYLIDISPNDSLNTSKAGVEACQKKCDQNSQVDLRQKTEILDQNGWQEFAGKDLLSFCPFYPKSKISHLQPCHLGKSKTWGKDNDGQVEASKQDVAGKNKMLHQDCTAL